MHKLYRVVAELSALSPYGTLPAASPARDGLTKGTVPASFSASGATTKDLSMETQVYAGWIQAFGAAIDFAGVALIAVGLLFAAVRYVQGLFSATADTYRRFRQDVGKAILLGLEALVAADIIGRLQSPRR